MRKAAHLVENALVALMVASCGLIDEGAENEPGLSSGSGGEGSTAGGNSNSGGAWDVASGGESSTLPARVPYEECVSILISGGRFTEVEAPVVCRECLTVINDECHDPELRCFGSHCDENMNCRCTANGYCAEDALREAGMGRLMCEHRSTDEVSCPAPQQYCSGEGEGEACFCDFFRPASKDDCAQHVNFRCLDGLRDCYCFGLPEEIKEYDCSLHAAWWESVEGMPQDCTLMCPTDDFTAHECDCVCGPI